MKTYVTQSRDSFAAIANKFQIRDEYFLKTFHNLNCPKEQIIREEIPAGTQILIPDDPQYLIEKSASEADNTAGDEVNSVNGYDETEPQAEAENPSKTDEKEQEEPQESSPGDHDGKYFVIQKGTVQCSQGFTFPKFKVTSHQKHYWNDADGTADYLAVTEDDLQLDPPAQPFGQCKLKPSSGGYLPCTYAPAGKWTKTYEKTKVMGKSCVTEASELMCSTGGKITILKHGQQSEPGKSNVRNADPQEQHLYNPIVDFEDFKEQLDDHHEDAW